jgi:hypothetical protein
MRVLDVKSDGDFGAQLFLENFDPKEVAKDMKPGDEKTVVATVVTADSWDEEIYVELYEFGDVDPKFIEFLRNYHIDYDHSKCHNFFIV